MSASTPANPFDQACRYLLRRGGLPFVAWLLRIDASSIRFVRWIDTRLTLPGLPERVGDTIAHVVRLDQGGLPWAIPVEFQAAPDELMFGRLLGYEGMIWTQEKPTEHAEDRFHLLAVVVNLTGVGRCGQRMAWQPGAESTLLPIEWNLETLDAVALLDRIAAGEAPRALLVWIPLMKNGGEAVTIQRWREMADAESDPRWKSDYALARVFADLSDRQTEWYKALEGFNVIQSRAVNEWKAEGAVKSKVEGIVGILQARFGPVPPEINTKLETTTALNLLQDWLVLTARVASLDEFRQAIGIK